jgi:hypothetical protein
VLFHDDKFKICSANLVSIYIIANPPNNIKNNQKSYHFNKWKIKIK